MRSAIEEAKRAGLRGSVPVGAVIVMNDTVISSAGNEVMKNSDPTAHAEILAIRRACSILKSRFLNECDLYVTLEPCAMCAQAVSLTRMRRLYFGAYDLKYGAVEFSPRIFDRALHKPEIVGGVFETQCEEMLQNFFRRKRN
jgi:tRNA(Arg) A34 adenosine deaminase TadA